MTKLVTTQIWGLWENCNKIYSSWEETTQQSFSNPVPFFFESLKSCSWSYLLCRNGDHCSRWKIRNGWTQWSSAHLLGLHDFRHSGHWWNRLWRNLGLLYGGICCAWVCFYVKTMVLGAGVLALCFVCEQLFCFQCECLFAFNKTEVLSFLKKRHYPEALSLLDVSCMSTKWAIFCQYQTTIPRIRECHEKMTYFLIETVSEIRSK